MDTSREGGVPAKNAKGERLLLFLGIIDILQNYRLLKKLEHTWKSVLHDGDSISVHNPSFYATRFQDYISEKVFCKGSADLLHSKQSHKFKSLVHSYIGKCCSSLDSMEIGFTLKIIRFQP